MSTAFNGILDLFTIFFVMIFTTDLFWGFTIGTFMVGASTFIILIYVVQWILSRSAKSINKTIRR